MTEPRHELLPAVISDSGLESLNFHSAVVILEEHILKLESESQKASKVVSKRGSSAAMDMSDDPGPSQDVWLQLCRLYHALGEKDIVLGLSERICMVDKGRLEEEGPIDKASTYRALEWDMSGELVKAYNEYEKLLDSHESGHLDWDVSEQEVDMWHLRRLDCLARLGKWEELCNKAQVDQVAVWDATNRARLLPYYARSLLFLSDDHKEQIGRILGDVSEGGKAEALGAVSPAFLAALYLRQGDLARAIINIDRSYRHFLTSWSSLHPCASSARKMQLQPLQFIVEMEDIVEMKQYETPEAMQALIAKWRSNLPSQDNDRTITWGTVGVQRLWGLGFKESKNEDSDEEDSDVMQPERLYHHVSFYLEASLAAIKQRDRFMGLSFLKQCGVFQRRLPEDVVARELSVRQLIALLKLRQLQLSQIVEMDLSWEEVEEDQRVRDRGLERTIFLRNLRVIHSNAEEGKLPVLESLALKAEWCEEFFFHISRSLTEAERTHTDISPSLQESREVYLKLWCPDTERIKVWDLHGLRSLVLADAYKFYEEFAKCEKGQSPGGRVASTYRSFARFCDKLLLPENQSSLSGATFGVNADQLSAQAVESYLKVAELAPALSQDIIPRVLMHFDEHPSASNTFKKFAVDVPTWTFLSWIPQLLAVLAGPKAKYILPVLIRIAQEYPQALFFPLNVTRESMSAEALRDSEILKVKLHQGCGDVLMKFSDALQHLVSARTQLLGEINRLADMVRDNMVTDILKPEYYKAKSRWESISEGMGADRKNELQELHKRVRGELGKVEGELGKGDQMNKQVLKKALNEVKVLMDPSKSPIRHEALRGYQKLSYFSTWLAEFQMSTGQMAKIEVPGQYGGLLTQPPRPDLHAHVVSIDSQVLILESKQLPKRIKIRGDDEKEHTFLVKGGEDLRNDERIEQLFEAMNLVMSADPACCQAGLSCRTYKVITAMHPII